MAGVRRFEELFVWQLSEELKLGIYKVIARPAVARDYDFSRQIRRSARAAPALIAEGFGRFRRNDFARYLELALGELAETRNHLRDGTQCGHFTVDEFRELWRICYRAKRAATGLLLYLKKSQPKDKRQRVKNPS
jgi:four helix bundle protein